MAPPDVVGMLLGDLLDVDPAHVAEQHHRLLAGPVPDDAGVVLLRDLGLGVDEHAARHVAADLELEDLGGMGLGLVRRVGELTPPAFIRPPLRTCDLTTTGPPIRSAASRASAAVFAKP